jgi:hypothetical protein
LILFCVIKRKTADEERASLPFLTGGVAGCHVCRGARFLLSKHRAKLREKFMI